MFLLPYIYIIHAFLAMFRTISNRQRSSLVQKNIPQNKKKSQSDRKCILVFAAMAIIFTCSWLPYFTIKLLLGIQVLLNVMEAVVIIRYITSFAKPLLYTGVFQTRLLVFLAKSVVKQGKRQPFCSKKIKILS